MTERCKKVEELWEELGDFSFNENADGELELAEGFHIFPKHTTREDIWHWFDEEHPKGVAYLLYEYKKEQEEKTFDLEEIRVKMDVYMKRNNFESIDEAIEHLRDMLEEEDMDCQIYEVEEQ